MSILTDFIYQFKQRILNRYTNKILPLSIKKEDHANSFNEISNALLLINPVGLKNQIQFVNDDNLNEYNTGDQVLIGQFITNDTEFSSAITRGAASQEEIFNKFNRYSHGIPSGKTNNIPGVPLETNSWSYDTGTNTINSTTNSQSAIGFFSNDKFDTYIHNVTLSSSAADNDFAGVVIAFMEDPSDMVTNHAFGLNPADFNWPIDITSLLIPNQHSLTVFRNREGGTLSYYIVYDAQKLTEKVISDGTHLAGLFNTSANWLNESVDMQITRSSTTISIKTSQFSDAPGGKGSLGFQLIVDLTSDPVLLKFIGKQPYGYAARSQQFTKFTNVSFSASNNVIYDLRTGNTYVFGQSGYSIDPSRSFFNEIGVRRILYNPYEFNLLYITSDLTIYTLASRLTNIIVVDINKRLPFTNQTSVLIDWQNNIAPESTLTYAQLFGNNPMFSIQINTGDNTYSGLKEFGEIRTKDTDQLSLLSVTFNFGPFIQTGEIIIE